MEKLLLLAILIFVFNFSVPTLSLAQGMTGFNNTATSYMPGCNRK